MCYENLIAAIQPARSGSWMGNLKNFINLVHRIFSGFTAVGLLFLFCVLKVYLFIKIFDVYCGIYLKKEITLGCFCVFISWDRFAAV